VRLALLAIGSRGDIEPMLALASELAGVGHQVRVATHPRYRSMAERAGVAFAPLAGGVLGAGPTPEARRWSEVGSRYLPAWMAYLEDARSVAGQRLADALEACADSDAVIVSALATLVGWQAAEHYRVPLVRAGVDMPRALSSRHGAVPAAIRAAMWLAIRSWLNDARRDVGLPGLPAHDPIERLNAHRVLWLRAYSPAVGAVPLPGREWIRVTGFWRLERPLDPDPSAQLVEFVQSGPPPVCIDFGSMADPAPQRTVTLAVDALDRAGLRGVVIHRGLGSGQLELPASVLGIPTVRHDWLFPRCAAVAHHGGAGTVCATLLAGVPTAPVPHIPPQAQWAQRLHALGVASEPIDRRRLTAERLGAALALAASSATMKRRAGALRAIVKREHGTVAARRLIEDYLGPGTQRSAIAMGRGARAVSARAAECRRRRG
jgi:sterol 3beta-glucosyltransferase